MFQLAGMLSLVGAALIAPGWFFSKKRGAQSFLLFLLPVIGVALWFFLATSGFGSQSLSNLIELFGVALAGVIAAYVKFFVFDKRLNNRKLGSTLALGIVAITVLCFRMFTPVLPE